MITIISFTVLILVIFIFVINSKYAGTGSKIITDYLFKLSHIYVLTTLVMDWGYDFTVFSPISSLYFNHFALPFTIFLSLFILVIHYNQFQGYLIIQFIFNLLQLGLIMPIVVYMEFSLHVSLLSSVTISSIAASFIGLTALINLSMYHIPPIDSYIGKIVYKERTDFFTALKILSKKLGVSYHAPNTILESGSLEGLYKECELTISSTLNLLPPGYTVEINLSGKNIKDKQKKTNFILPKGILTSSHNSAHFIFRSLNKIPIDENNILHIIKTMSQ